MAAPDLAARSTSEPKHHLRKGEMLPAGLARAWRSAYAAVWGATLLFAAIDACSGPWLAGMFGAEERFHLSPLHTPQPNVLVLLILVALNLPRMSWPLALSAIRAHRHPLTRHLADILVCGVIARNTLWIGSVLGAYGPRTLLYTPQLPVEWAAVALGGAGWLIQRRRPMSRHETRIVLALIAALVVLAGLIETYGVPHQ